MDSNVSQVISPHIGYAQLALTLIFRRYEMDITYIRKGFEKGRFEDAVLTLASQPLLTVCFCS
jgi:hypothetical protein